MEINNNNSSNIAPEVICIGQAVVDCITRGVEDDPLGMGKTRANSITLNLGGDAVNESFVLTSLGRRAGLVCAVGDDLAGRFVANEAERRGLDMSGVTMVPGLVTPVANMFVKLSGSRSSVTSMASLLPGYVPSADHRRRVCRHTRRSRECCCHCRLAGDSRARHPRYDSRQASR